jgi:hypothetical protein
MRIVILRIAIAAIVVVCISPFATVSEVAAQATCRQKCTDEEQACLRRTGNKGQCGERAKICIASCK